MVKDGIPDSKHNRVWQAADGTVGVPGVTNKFVTEEDKRLPGDVTTLEDVVTVANDASLCTLISKTLTGDVLATGTTIEIDAFGSVACQSGASLTMMWKIIYGDTVGTGAVLLTMDGGICSASVNAGWYFHALITVRDIGVAASGSILANAVLMGDFATEPTVKVSKASTATAIVTTKDQIIALAFIWSAANAANSLTVENAVIKITKR